jgi:NADH-quinone oxidoreductase subunit K
MTVAAAEAAIGLAIVISLFRNRQTVNIDEINLLKG